MRMSFRRISSSLCRVARAMVLPARSTGSSSATGLRMPVLPTWMVMALSRVRAVSGLYLKAMAQRGALSVAPASRCCSTSSSFTTAPSVP
jgi:hypothetical protein